MDEGTAAEFGPGDTSVIPLGHNAWVIGNEMNLSSHLTLQA
jgi:hypothetical protein